MRKVLSSHFAQPCNELNSNQDKSYYDDNEEKDNCDTNDVPVNDLTENNAVDNHGTIVSNDNSKVPYVDDSNGNNDNNNNADNNDMDIGDDNNDDDINNDSDHNVSTGQDNATVASACVINNYKMLTICQIFCRRLWNTRL